MLINNSSDTNKAAVLNNIITNQRFYNNNTNLMRPSECKRFFPNSIEFLFKTFPKKVNSPQLHNDVIDSANQQSLSYPKEIEDEVEKFIQRLFNKSLPLSSSLSVDDFCDILARLKESHDKKEKVKQLCRPSCIWKIPKNKQANSYFLQKDFYNYALKYLIDGNTCLYSLDDMQFHTMSVLWGVMIDRGILSHLVLGYCLKLLLQMLNKPTNTKYYFFSVKVLDRCKSR
jgi:hypothetical protein